jgi:hypothetical protein
MLPLGGVGGGGTTEYIAGMTDPFIFQQYEKYCGG